ncbi:hypothetical protein N0V85_007262 [Neurospora sp. IMI 360204]|nr:hypothetical protein N0V85_007262 [Neurospora sp. IMI 360204]
MAHQTFQSHYSTNAGSSVSIADYRSSIHPTNDMRQRKRNLEDQDMEQIQPAKKLKCSEDKSVGHSSSEDNDDNAISVDKESISSSHPNSTPPSGHSPNTHDILLSIEEDDQPVPTAPERHTSSPKETLESTDEEDTDNLPSDLSSSFIFSATVPSPSESQSHNASSATASPMRPSFRSREDFSPSLGTPFSSYTSISEGDSDEEDSDEEDWNSDMFNIFYLVTMYYVGMVLDWQAPAPALQGWPEVTFGEDSIDHNSDGHDGEEYDETEA